MFSQVVEGRRCKVVDARQVRAEHVGQVLGTKGCGCTLACGEHDREVANLPGSGIAALRTVGNALVDEDGVQFVRHSFSAALGLIVGTRAAEMDRVYSGMLSSS